MNNKERIGKVFVKIFDKKLVRVKKVLYFCSVEIFLI